MYRDRSAAVDCAELVHPAAGDAQISAGNSIADQSVMRARSPLSPSPIRRPAKTGADRIVNAPRTRKAS